MINFPLGALFALASNLCFAAACIYFSRLGKRYGVMWLNTIKVGLAFCLLLPFTFFIPLNFDLTGVGLLLLSGMIGLGIGDYFLFRALCEIGPSRTLILFAFQPIIFLAVDIFFFRYDFAWQSLISIALFIICLLIFTYEGKKRKLPKNRLGILFAFLGVMLDGCGIFLTKTAFVSYDVHPIMANLIRDTGALLFFAIWHLRAGTRPDLVFLKLSTVDKKQVLLACFFGTFLSLFMYMFALKLEKVSVVTAITITSPLWGALFETYVDKRRPTPELMVALVLFLVAFANFLAVR